MWFTKLESLRIMFTNHMNDPMSRLYFWPLIGSIKGENESVEMAYKYQNEISLNLFRQLP